ncbi:hypothetical protein [Sabulicella rubraurantiaca]|nr:hypothetical protein [Sabulicella rubraurantiaca]
MNTTYVPRGLPAHSGTTTTPSATPRPGTALSAAEIRQIVLDILG